jgi:hypothetical protein
MRNIPVIFSIVLLLVISGCTSTQQPVATPEPTIAVAASPTPAPTVTRPQAGVDPIVGAWDNGLVFDAEGYVNGDRNISWKANDMEKYSYFVTVESRGVKDVEAGKMIDPSALSQEWIYNPYSDSIHKRGSNEGIRRVLEGSVPPGGLNAPPTTAPAAK